MSEPLTPAQTALAKAMPEAELQETVRSACRTLGLLFYHCHRSQHSPAGFPDVVAVGPNRMLYRELKRENGKVTAEQQKWLAALTATGADAGVWRPADWFSGRIMAELRAVSTRQ